MQRYGPFHRHSVKMEISPSRRLKERASDAPILRHPDRRRRRDWRQHRLSPGAPEGGQRGVVGESVPGRGLERQVGADIRQGVEVKSILTEKNRVMGVETNEGRYECGRLVLATGPWAAQLAGTVGLKLPVQACRTQVALFRRPPECGRRGAVYGD